MTGAAAMRARRASRRRSGTAVFAVVLVLFPGVTVLRFTRGLGAVTNLSDHFPWGLWIGFDVLCGVGLAAGAFTLTAIVHIFNLHRFEPIVRPTVLTGFLGYLLVIAGLLFDLGQPWRIWHALVFWNPHSVMFEVAWCVMLYTTVLALEFSPVVLERLAARAAAPHPARDHHAAGHRRRHPLDPASVLARLALPDRPLEAASALVLAAAAVPLLHLGDRRRHRHGHPRVVPRAVARLRPPSRDGAARTAGARHGRGARRLRRAAPASSSSQNGAVARCGIPATRAAMFLLELSVGVLLPVGLLLFARRAHPSRPAWSSRRCSPCSASS